MRNLLKMFWERQKAFATWLHKEFQRSMQNVANSLMSMRILWVWLIMALYFFVVIFSLINYGHLWAAIAVTAITVTGGMVSWILTNYVISKQHDKVLKNQVKIEKMKQENGASD